jgi:hypothetical protein
MVIPAVLRLQVSGQRVSKNLSQRLRVETIINLDTTKMA